MPSLATLALYLLAGTAIGLLALFSGIPAAPLAGPCWVLASSA